MRGRGNYLTEPSRGFPVIPMIDVIFNLLLFFMVISRYLPPSLNVSLPEASAATPDNRPSVAIGIDAQGSLLLDGQAEPWGELPKLLGNIAATPGGDKTHVRIAADKGASYDYVVRALDAAAQAGLTQVALETAPGASTVVTQHKAPPGSVSPQTDGTAGTDAGQPGEGTAGH